MVVAVSGLAIRILSSQQWSDDTDPSRSSRNPAPSVATVPMGPVPHAGELPGEFEQHDALLVCWPDKDRIAIGDAENSRRLNARMRRLNVEIVGAVHSNIQVVILIDGPAARQRAEAALRASKVQTEAIRFVQIPHESSWIRDYGPLSTRNSNGGTLVSNELTIRTLRNPRNAKAPTALASALGIEMVSAPIYLEGGNLISNGDGLLLTTNLMLEDNRQLDYDQAALNQVLQTLFGARQIVYLKSLQGEGTRHVDMFATFTSRDTVVIGEYTADQDPVNRKVLEQNAQKLRALKTSRGPLKVVRIPMPPRDMPPIFGGSYTNVVYANRVCVVPSYGTIDAEGLAKAKATYRRLLPDWTIVDVDASVAIFQGGAIHCLSLNIHRLPRKRPPRSSP